MPCDSAPGVSPRAEAGVLALVHSTKQGLNQASEWPVFVLSSPTYPQRTASENNCHEFVKRGAQRAGMCCKCLI